MDLFSDCEFRQSTALCALLDNPQNNFRVWLNGHALLLPPVEGTSGTIPGQTKLTWLSLLKVVLVCISCCSKMVTLFKMMLLLYPLLNS